MTPNAISGIDLSREEIKGTFFLHIPHSSTRIPDYAGFDLEKVENNLARLTDWATDEIFDVHGIGKIVTPFSRLFCDVERLGDDAEPMHKIGRGFFYTKGYDGSELRKMDADFKQRVFRDYYQAHHALFFQEVDKRLKRYGVCHIVDCHSFNEEPIGSLLYQPASPDICLGTDAYHTPDYLLRYTVNFWAGHGFSVEMNNPYSGCIIPIGFFGLNKNVKGIMIEINKRLYMDDIRVNEEKVNRLKTLMNAFFDGFTNTTHTWSTQNTPPASRN